MQVIGYFKDYELLKIYKQSNVLKLWDRKKSTETINKLLSLAINEKRIQKLIYKGKDKRYLEQVFLDSFKKYSADIFYFIYDFIRYKERASLYFLSDFLEKNSEGYKYIEKELLKRADYKTYKVLDDKVFFNNLRLALHKKFFFKTK